MLKVIEKGFKDELGPKFFRSRVLSSDLIADGFAMLVHELNTGGTNVDYLNRAILFTRNPNDYGVILDTFNTVALNRSEELGLKKPLTLSRDAAGLTTIKHGEEKYHLSTPTVGVGGQNTPASGGHGGR